MTNVNEKLLDERLSRLEAARRWSPRVLSKLESHIRSADDEALFRINALSFARDKAIAEEEAIELFLHACVASLFVMDWLLLCPKCSCVVDSFRSLKSVNNRYHCGLCLGEFESVLDEYIAVGFTLSAEVRPLAFHRPESLSAWDYFFAYKGRPEGRAPNGAPFIEFQKSSARTVTFLPPGETTTVELEAESGTVFAACHEGGVGILYHIVGAPSCQPQAFSLEVDEKVLNHEERLIAPGRISFAIANHRKERGALCLCVLPPGARPGGLPLSFDPFLSGQRLVTNHIFRDLFRSESVRSREGLGVRDVTVLFTDLKDSTVLYDHVGDLNAFALVQRHFDRLLDVVVRNHGAVVKTIGDAVMAAFREPVEAVRAALEMRADIASLNEPGRLLILKIGIHRGPAIVVTLNDRLDYFGQTINIASRIQNLADANEIYLSGDVWEASGVKSLLAVHQIQGRSSPLKGVQADMTVYRVSAS
jgi:class 3 adenylate cyclase